MRRGFDEPGGAQLRLEQGRGGVAERDRVKPRPAQALERGRDVGMRRQAREPRQQLVPGLGGEGDPEQAGRALEPRGSELSKAGVDPGHRADVRGLKDSAEPLGQRPWAPKERLERRLQPGEVEGGLVDVEEDGDAHDGEVAGGGGADEAKPTTSRPLARRAPREAWSRAKKTRGPRPTRAKRDVEPGGPALRRGGRCR